MAENETRRRLRVVIKLMLLFGLLMVLYVFGAAFFSLEKRESNPDAMPVGISQVLPGETLKVNWEGRPILIHRRTDAEINWLGQAQGGLADAVSARSVQPNTSKNPYRSEIPEWFVALAVREDKACTIEFDTENEFGGYVSPCDGIRFDAAGRLFAGQKIDANVNNMRVPLYGFEGDLLLLGARSR